ncbi:MAG: hypothetical protein V4736_02980, partial [Bdellovibrionota bacterium]
LDFPEQAVSSYTDMDGKLLIEPGARQVLTVKMDGGGNMYPWVKSRNCDVKIVKDEKVKK